MISGYVKCGQGQKALDLFQQMQQEGVELDPITLVGVLNVCASVVALDEGMHAHELIMQCGWDSDVFLGSSLVDMYAKCGSMHNACRVFNKMSTWDLVTWIAMIFGHLKCGQGYEALELFRKMWQEAVQPGPVTFIGVLNACACVVALEESRQVHEQIIENG
jgi:pentatricopeptide repeat protein